MNNCVNRQLVFDIIENARFKAEAIAEIEKLPAEVAENKAGHWIEHNEDYYFWVECSVCHGERRYGNEYCPDCGSHNGDMRNREVKA